MTHIGPYRVVEEVARGGVGRVFRALDPAGRAVALKHLLHAPTGPVARRFAREVEALARLRHPNVVTIHAAGRHQGRPYLVLEWVEGRSLEERLARDGPLEERAAARLVQELALALEYVHGCGLLHRDLKPGNVLLAPDGRPLLTDFGLVYDAEVSRSRLTRTGAFLGTPGYWAPEQTTGRWEDLGPATDVYGLGGVLYAALTGRPPHEADSLMTALDAAVAPVAPPSAHRPSLDRELEAICLQCLAVATEQRLASPAAVARELGRYLRGAPSPARRASRRRWALATAALAAGAAGALGVGVATSGGEARGARPSPPSAPASGSVAHDPPTVESPARPSSEGADAAAASPPGGDKAALELQGRELLRAMVAAQERGEAAAAEEAYRALLELDLPPGQALTGRAAARMRRNDLEGADADLTRLIAQAPQDLSLRVARRDIRAEQHRYQDALPDADVVVSLTPRDPGAWYTRSLLRRSCGDGEGALADADRAEELAPEHPGVAYARAGALLLLGRSTEAVDAYDRALELRPGAAPVLVARASARWVTADPGGTVEDLLEAERLGAALGPADLSRLARGLLLLDRVDEAHFVVGRLLKAPEDDPLVLAASAETLLELGRGLRALEVVERAARGRPSAEVIVLRGLARLETGAIDEAAHDAEQVLTAHPDHGPGLALRARLLLESGQTGEALEAAERAVTLTPRAVVTWAALAAVLRRVDRPEELLAKAAEAARRLPGRAQPFVWQAQAAARLGRLEDALALLNEALAHEPSIARVRALRGWCLAQLDRMAAAVADFEGALRLDPTHAAAWHDLARALWALDRHDEARRALDLAFEHVGDDRRLPALLERTRAAFEGDARGR